MTWSRTRPVFVGEDDASGLIYFPTYLHYMSEGEQLLFVELGFPVTQQIADRVAMPVVHAECDYVAPARAGDVLTHSIELSVGRRSSVVCRHEFAKPDGEVVARAHLVRVMTDLDTLRPVAVSPSVRELLDHGRPAHRPNSVPHA
ncbi:acyl-CoA thioesterase [Nocardioides carbamazepini]|uniref:acyl-CoA thioesterase n=1 Tax=Nocardioides carbamazepini TaxID=2854259 RepID=UPI00214A4BDD|nr:thioesterase family protein [Nocardioides carbamazepini]MCR1781366.1 acyl-CoA thioesterase [Nocardioides carbamazepini]